MTSSSLLLAGADLRLCSAGIAVILTHLYAEQL
jgi:hypothetical protein